VETPEVLSATNKKSILIIDDGEVLLELQKSLLEMEGFEVFTAQSGTKDLELLSRIDKPDLILLDVRMEDMSGPDFLNLLENKRPELASTVPIAFVSAMDKAPPGNVVGFIRKPFDMDYYLKTIHRFIDAGRFSTLNH